MEIYQNMLNFDNKVVLITGGTGGLGSEIGVGFYHRGATVILAGRDESKFHDVVSSIENLDTNRFIYEYVDFLDCDSIEDMVHRVLSHCQKIDVLINSCGINILKNIEDFDMEDFNLVMDVNVNSVHKICKLVGRHMIDNQKGSIINVSSVKSLLAVEENYSAYCASKAALNMYSKELACEWAKYNIRCNVIAPTFIKTDINKDQLNDPKFRKNIEDRIPMRRIGQKEDIAHLALFLASEQANFITGQVICLDGGLTARQ